MWFPPGKLIPRIRWLVPSVFYYNLQNAGEDEGSGSFFFPNGLGMMDIGDPLSLV